ncbi:MAG TPA: helix-hairpin-helix domain-containing protein [Actinomycetota bacterium]
MGRRIGVIKERIEERLGQMDRRELAGLLLIAMLVVAGAVFWYVRSLPSRVQISTVSHPAFATGPVAGPTPAATPSPAEVVVDVAGWVRHPGVFRFHQGDRVIDAIHRAGGAKEKADLQSINLAALLTDGEQIIVGRRGASGSGPSSSGVTSGTGSTGSGGEAGQLVNLNTATLDELETLSGIGEVLGQRIIDYREQHGPFRTIEDLMNVSGIGDKRFADLKPYITV